MLLDTPVGQQCGGAIPAGHPASRVTSYRAHQARTTGRARSSGPVSPRPVGPTGRARGRCDRPLPRRRAGCVRHRPRHLSVLARGEGALEVLQSGGRGEHRQLHPRLPSGRLVGPRSATEAMKPRLSPRRRRLKPALSWRLLRDWCQVLAWPGWRQLPMGFALLLGALVWCVARNCPDAGSAIARSGEAQEECAG